MLCKVLAFGQVAPPGSSACKTTTSTNKSSSHPSVHQLHQCLAWFVDVLSALDVHQLRVDARLEVNLQLCALALELREGGGLEIGVEFGRRSVLPARGR